MCGHETDGAGVPLEYCAPEEIAPHCPAGGTVCPGHPAGEYLSRCPACGDVIDYCRGHGAIGDPAGRAILDAHDAGDHAECHPDGCEGAHPKGCACEACDPLYQMTREGDTP